jgi:hypothetical protein
VLLDLGHKIQELKWGQLAFRKQNTEKCETFLNNETRQIIRAS